MPYAKGILAVNSTVAQVATGLGSANALFVALAPKQAGEVAIPPLPFRMVRCSAAMFYRRQPLTARPAPVQAYGVKVGGASRWLLEYNGHMLLASAILSAMTLAGCELNNAVAWSCVPYAVFVLQGILQGRAGKYDVDVASQFLLLTINAFM